MVFIKIGTAENVYAIFLCFILKSYLMLMRKALYSLTFFRKYVFGGPGVEGLLYSQFVCLGNLFRGTVFITVNALLFIHNAFGLVATISTNRLVSYPI